MEKKDVILKLRNQPISLKEYLILRGSNVLTRAEALVLGISWPLRNKWVKHYPGVIDLAMYQHLKDARKVKITKRARRLEAAGRVTAPLFQCFAASDEFLNSYEWRKLRMVALELYGPVCMACGATPKTGAVVNVDHIKPRRLYPGLALELGNLQVLCHQCNHGKGNWSMRDWRSPENMKELAKHTRG